MATRRAATHHTPLTQQLLHNIREHCIPRPWALRNCQNPWDSLVIRETWQVWPNYYARSLKRLGRSDSLLGLTLYSLISFYKIKSIGSMQDKNWNQWHDSITFVNTHLSINNANMANVSINWSTQSLHLWCGCIPTYSSSRHCLHHRDRSTMTSYVT